LEHNSIRLQIDNVRRLVTEWAPDVLCLQETKTPDELFPREAFEALGYRHMLVHGMKGYNGVAILSRAPLQSSGSRAWCNAPIADMLSPNSPVASNFITFTFQPEAIYQIRLPTLNSPISCSFWTR
jgi:exonuclease III